MRRYIWFVIYDGGYLFFGQAMSAVAWAEREGFVVKKVRDKPHYSLMKANSHTKDLVSVGSISKETIVR